MATVVVFGTHRHRKLGRRRPDCLAVKSVVVIPQY